MCALALLLAFFLLAVAWARRGALIPAPRNYTALAGPDAGLTAEEQALLESWSDELESAGYIPAGNFRGDLDNQGTRTDHLRAWLSVDRRTWAHASVLCTKDSRLQYLTLGSLREGGGRVGTVSIELQNPSTHAASWEGHPTTSARELIERHNDHLRRAADGATLVSHELDDFVSFLVRDMPSKDAPPEPLTWKERLRAGFFMINPLADRGETLRRRTVNLTVLMAAATAGAAALAWADPAGPAWPPTLQSAIAVLAILVLRTKHPLVWVYGLLPSEAILWATGHWDWSSVAVALGAAAVSAVIRALPYADASKDASPTESKARNESPPAPPGPTPLKHALKDPPRTANPSWRRRFRPSPVHLIATALCAPVGILIIGVFAYMALEQAAFQRSAARVKAVVTHSAPGVLRFEHEGATGQDADPEVLWRNHPVGSSIEAYRSGFDLRSAEKRSRTSWGVIALAFALFGIPGLLAARAARRAAPLQNLWKSGVEARATLVSQTADEGLPCIHYRLTGSGEVRSVPLRADASVRPLPAPEDPALIVVLTDPADPRISAPALEGDH